jgi:type IV secretory pathway VirB2 component (pilin)
MDPIAAAIAVVALIVVGLGAVLAWRRFRALDGGAPSRRR